LDQRLTQYYPIVYIDAVFISTMRVDQVGKEVFYTVLGLRQDRTKEALAIVNKVPAAGRRCVLIYAIED